MATPFYLNRDPGQIDWMTAMSLANPNMQSVQQQSAAIPDSKAVSNALDVNPALQGIPMSNANDPYLQGATRVDRAKLGKYMADLEGLINNRRGRIDELKSMPQGIDFTALGALADQLNGGGNMTNAMKAIAPMSKDERAKMAIGLEQQLAGDTQGLAGLQASILRSDQDALARSVNDKNMRSDLNRDHRLYKDVAAPVQKYGAEFQEKIGNINKLDNLFKDPNASVQDVKQELVNMAKGIGGDSGNIGEKEQLNYSASTLPDELNMFAQKLSGERVSGMSDASRDALQRLVERGRGTIVGIHRNKLNNARKSWQPFYSNTNVNVPIEQMFKSHMSDLDKLDKTKAIDDDLKGMGL